MARYAHSYSRIAAALLALTAACGSGLPAPASKFGVRMQDPAELDTENGLVAVSLSDACLSLSSAPTSTDPVTGITYTTTTWTDPLTGITYTQTTSTDPLTGISSTTTTATDPLTGTTTTTSTTTPILVVAPTATIDPNACGIGSNGMPPNLLGVTGLNPTSLNDDHFRQWFAADPREANLLMKYLVKCSLPLGLGMDYEYGGISYTWAGLLNLAPHWAAGEPIPEDEQQLVSACLGAHANRYGAHVPISLLGQYADGTPIPIGDDELSTFSLTEGCFFGNLFRGDGVFSANDRPLALTDDQSS